MTYTDKMNAAHDDYLDTLAGEPVKAPPAPVAKHFSVAIFYTTTTAPGRNCAGAYYVTAPTTGRAKIAAKALLNKVYPVDTIIGYRVTEVAEIPEYDDSDIA